MVDVSPATRRYGAALRQCYGRLLRGPRQRARGRQCSKGDGVGDEREAACPKNRWLKQARTVTESMGRVGHRGVLRLRRETLS